MNNTRAKWLAAAGVLAMISAASYALAMTAYIPDYDGIEALTGMVAYGFLAGACLILGLYSSARSAAGRLVAPAVRYLSVPTPMAPAPPTEKNDQWHVLGGLRFVLAACIVCVHVMVIVDNAPEQVGWLGHVVWATGSTIVLPFFLISGYSIAASFERDPAGYAWRRFWRIAPVFWLGLAASTAVMLAYKSTGTVSRLDLVMNALCLQTWITHPLKAFGPSWTLACEAFYYCLTPWFARQTNRTLLAIAASSLALYLYHASIPEAISYPGDWHGAPVACLAWWWLAGFLFYRFRASEAAKNWLIIVSVVMLPFDWKSFQPGCVYSMLIAVMIITNATRIRVPKILVKPLDWMGGMSYPLYAVHFAVITFVYARYGHQLGSHRVEYVLASLAAGALAYQLFDLPTQWLVRNVRIRVPDRVVGWARSGGRSVGHHGIDQRAYAEQDKAHL